MINKLFASLALFSCLGICKAATIEVGSCVQAQHSYTTITEAIKAAPAYSTISICPGTYAEQLFIIKPLTLKGIGTVNITSPTGGMIQQGTAGYSAILVHNAAGPVNLNHLTIAPLGISAYFGEVSLGEACGILQIQNFSGITYQDTPGTIQNVNVSSAAESYGDTGGPGGLQQNPDFVPNCGIGIGIYNSAKQLTIVRDSVIAGNMYGIYASGLFAADHNTVTAFGPFAIGIASTTSVITNNTVQGGLTSYTESPFLSSRGISGGEFVYGNSITQCSTAIQSASYVDQNKLLNNINGISGAQQAGGNSITAPATWLDPSCTYEYYNPIPPCIIPSTGINLACHNPNSAQGNTFTGLGIGLESAMYGASAPRSDKFNNVATPITSCTK